MTRGIGLQEERNIFRKNRFAAARIAFGREQEFDVCPVESTAR
jgi:hypothetical protein